MTPAIAQLFQHSLRCHELAALEGVEVHVVLRQDGVAAPVTVGGISSRLVHVRVDASGRAPAPATRAMLCIEVHDGGIRIDVPVEVVASGRTASVLRMLAAPLVLRRRMVRDQQLGEALGVAQPPVRDVPLVA